MSQSTNVMIKDFDHLQDLLNENDGHLECYIILKGGLRSSKTIQFDGVNYHVHNEIDDSWQDDLTKEQVLEETNIGKALEVGALYQY